MTMQEWIKKYEAKANPVHFEGWTVHYEEDKGFLAWKKYGEALIMGDCCGDFAWIHDYCMEKARENGCRVLATFTKRNPRAFIRKAYMMGYNVHFDVSGSRYHPNGKWYWLMTEAVK